MFYQRRVTRNLIFLVCVLPAMAGCHVLEALHDSPEGEKFLGAVRTGGPLASAKTLAIPLEGLTLADAVEQSIRPGLIVSAGSGTTGPPVLPVGEQKLTLDKDIRGIVNQIRPRANTPENLKLALETAVFSLAKLGDESPELRTELQKRLDKASDAGLFTPLTADEPENSLKNMQFRELYQDLVSIINAPVPNAENPYSATQLSPPTTSDKIAVRLTRRAGNRIVVPLPMVRSYSPGDIWLADGDQIHIMPLGMTEAGQQLPGQSGETISSKGIGQLPGVNLLILTHTSVLDGRPEEYLLPASNLAYYGNASFVQQWQNSIYLHGADQLKAGSLEMNPVIRKSQINTVAASAAALEERMNPAVDSLTDKLHRKLTRTTVALGNLPVISQVRNQIEQQVGPVSLRSPIQQTTGFNREEFCQSLTP